MRRTTFVLITLVALGVSVWLASGRHDGPSAAEDPKADTPSSRPAGSALRAGGRGPTTARVVPEPLPEEPAPVWPALSVPYVVEVVTRDGTPIAGATVRLRSRDGSNVASKETDGGGRAVFDPPPDPRATVVVVADDHASVATLVANVNPRRVVLGPGFRLDGTVVERFVTRTSKGRDGALGAALVVERRPVAGARVRLGALGWSGEALDETVTDAAGRFRLRGVPAAPHGRGSWVLLTAEADEGRLRGGSALDVAPDAARVGIEVPVARGAPVRGLVVDADGRRANGASVALVPAEAVGPQAGGEPLAALAARARSWMTSGTTDPTGAFDLFAPAAGGPFVVVAEPPSIEGVAGADAPSGALARRRRPGTSAPFTIPEGATELPAVVIVLGRAGGVAVRVRDAGGVPVRPDAVTLERDRRIVPAEPETSGTPDPADATFLAGGLEGGTWTLRVRGRLHAETTRAVEVVEGEDVEVDVVVTTGVRVVGTIVDEEGRPLAGAAIEVLAPAEPPATGFVVVRHATSGADGGFDVAMLPEGPLRLRAAGAGRATVGDGVEVDGGRTGLRVPTTRLGRARLVLATSDGRPLPPTASVTVGEVTRPADVRTAEVRIVDGVLVVEALSGAREEIAVDVDGYAPFARSVAVPPGSEVDLGRVVLSAGRRVTGLVRDARGEPVLQARVVAAGGRLETTTDGDGRFVLDGVPDGVIGVTVVAEGFDEATAQVAVRGADAALDVALLRAAVVTGTVWAKDGALADGERLEFVRIDAPDDETRVGASAAAALRTDEDGTFAISLPPGRYRIQARELDRTGDTLAEVVAERGATRALRLTLPR